jgi:AraC-like DNA-binding protein
MSATVPQHRSAGLEGSCGASPRDWLRLAPDTGGIERIEAFFAGHAFDLHRHDTYALGLTLSGVQQFDYRGAEATSLTGDLIVIHPDEVHNGRAGAETGFRYRMAYIEPRLIRDALGERASALPFVRRAVLDDTRLRNALVRLLSDLDRALEPLETDQALAEVADALVALDASAVRQTAGTASALAVERARAFLDANHDRVVASDELEEITGLNRFEIARQFRRRLGTSPYRYLTMRRLDRARALIRSGVTLAETALAAGFADQSHLTRQFRAAYGLSPGRWREMRASGRGAR